MSWLQKYQMHADLKHQTWPSLILLMVKLILKPFTDYFEMQDWHWNGNKADRITLTKLLGDFRIKAILC